MKKIKFLIASMLGGIALVFACVLGTKVNADTLHNIDADFTDISATITENSTGTGKTLYDNGWRYVVTNGSQTVGEHTYGKIKPAGYIQSPNFVNSSGDTITKTVNISISVYTNDTKSSLPFVISGYDSTDTVVATAEGTAGGTTNGVFISNNLTLTSTTNDIKYVKFVGCYKGDSAKNGCVSTFNISFTEIDSSASRVHFFVDGEEITSKEIENGSIVMPTNPTKEGCTFNGWFNADGTEFTNSSLTDDTNVYADFTRNSLTPSQANVYTLNVSDLVTGDITDETTYGQFTILPKNDSGNEVSIEANTKGEFTKRLKLQGTGSSTARAITFTINRPMTITVYGMTGKSSETRNLMIYDGTTESTLLSHSGDSMGNASLSLAAGEYAIYSGTNGFNIYALYLSEAYYTPNVSLSVDANSNNTKVRVTAAIDNVNIVSNKVSGIESMQYTIEGKEWSKDITNVYTSVDNANSGFYRNKDYTVYAIVVFDGYNNLTTDFDITFTVTLATGQSVSKTITVVAPSA